MNRGSIHSNDHEHHAPGGGAPGAGGAAEGVRVVMSDQGQSERVVMFLATWLEEPMTTAIVVEHRGAGARVILDTVLLESPDDDDDDDDGDDVIDGDDDGGGALSEESPPPPPRVRRRRRRPRRRRRRLRRPDPQDVMVRFGQVIGEHAVALLAGDEPCYGLVAEARHGRTLAQCQVWAHPPSPVTRGRGFGGDGDGDGDVYGGGGGGSAMVTLCQQPPFGMVPAGAAAAAAGMPGGPRGGHHPHHRGRGFGTAAGPPPPAAAPPFGTPEMWRQDGEHEVEVIGMLTQHVQQLMRQQERTTEASLGAMASQCAMLMERNRILEAERTETLAMQRRIHDQLLSSEAERYRMKVHASVEEDIQRAVDAEERSKNRLLEQGLERLLPTLKMALGQLSGADVVMRLLNEFPDGVLDQILPMLSPAQREILDTLGVLDAHIDEAALAHVGNPAFDAVIAPEVERRHRAAAAAEPAGAGEAAAATPAAPHPPPAAASADNEKAMAEAPSPPPPPNAQRVPPVMSPPPSASPSPPPPPVAATAAPARRPSPPPPPSPSEVASSSYGLPSPPPSAEPPAPPPLPPSKTLPSSDASSRVPSSPASASVSPPPPPPSRPCPPTKETTFVVRGALPSPSPDDSS